MIIWGGFQTFFPFEGKGNKETHRHCPNPVKSFMLLYLFGNFSREI
jgi:hypothetical protein